MSNIESPLANYKITKGTQFEWVSVRDSLPEEDEYVLIYNKGRVIPAEYNTERKQFQRYPNHVDGDRCVSYFYTGVTHWQFFPYPPTK